MSKDESQEQDDLNTYTLTDNKGKKHTIKADSAAVEEGGALVFWLGEEDEGELLVAYAPHAWSRVELETDDELRDG